MKYIVTLIVLLQNLRKVCVLKHESKLLGLIIKYIKRTTSKDGKICVKIRNNLQLLHQTVSSLLYQI